MPQPDDDTCNTNDFDYDYHNDIYSTEIKHYVASRDSNISGISFTDECVHDSNSWFNCLCIKKFQFGFIPQGHIAAFPTGNTVHDHKHHKYTSYLELFHALRGNRIPNCMGARIPVPTSMNIGAWEYHLRNYYDPQLIDFLKYGFPIDLVSKPEIDNVFVRNHPTATQYPMDVNQYITKETQHKAILGPFSVSPITGIHCSPMLTRPKPGADSRRVIVDLSWPKMGSINHNVASDIYMGTPFKLKFPTIDDIVNRIISFKGKCLLYKVDIRRAFRILKLDPQDIAFTGLQWQGKFYVDTSIPFGYRHGSVCCQRVTDAVRYIMHTQGVQHLFNYIDDFIGVDYPAVADSHFQKLLHIMAQLGIPISEEKLFPPSTEVPCLGILINTSKGSLRIPDEKLNEVNLKCIKWASKSTATKKQLQSLVGSLIYIHKCVKPARLFVNRILATLRESPEQGCIQLSQEFKKDIAWFNSFLVHFNGRTFFSKGFIQPVTNIYLDACLVGLGGVWNQQVYQCLVPTFNCAVSIVHYEMINILVALRLWVRDLNGKRLVIHCDNAAVVSILNTGKGQDSLLLAIARNVWLCAANSDIDLTLVHIPGKNNIIADLLSRWQILGTNRNNLYVHIPKPKWQKIVDEFMHIDFDI